MEQLSTIQQINQSIMFGDFTDDQLNSIISAVKFARGCLAKSTKRQHSSRNLGALGKSANRPSRNWYC